MFARLPIPKSTIRKGIHVVDPAKVEGRVRLLDEYLKVLRRLATLPQQELIADPIPLGSAKYYLQVAIESCIDMANHIIASERFRAPKDYADAFKVLSEEGIVPADFLSGLQRMARFRNRLVHLYWEVDAEMIYEILQQRLDEFGRYRACILTVLERSAPQRSHEDKR
jgi:uncharacterized protein YutE (UPF0331/DUF86 family)